MFLAHVSFASQLSRAKIRRRQDVDVDTVHVQMYARGADAADARRQMQPMRILISRRWHFSRRLLS